LKNVTNLKPITLLMIGVGGLIAFWLGRDAGFPGMTARGAHEQRRPAPEPQGPRD
jgi:hypothetical protein